jgi:hypothetical protein
MRLALRRITRPESGFLDRVESGVHEYQRDVETWHAAVDLLSLGWRTFEVMMDENHD